MDSMDITDDKSSIGKKILKFVLILIIVIVVIIWSMVSSYTPGIKNMQEVLAIVDKFNQTVDTTELIQYTINNASIQSCIQKFNNNEREIFSSQVADYRKMLKVDKTEKKEISLNMREYSYLRNTLKNCTSFLSDRNINTLISRTIYSGTNKGTYITSILVKFDISNLITSFNLSDIVKNNLYFTISKNLAGEYSYKINGLDAKDTIVIVSFLEDMFVADTGLSSYKVDTLTKKIYDEYEKLTSEFEKFVNISIIT